MSSTEPEGPAVPVTPRQRQPRRRTVRLRTLLIWLAVAPTVAMGTQTVMNAERLLEQSAHLRADVAASEEIGIPLYTLLVDLQAERTATAARWAGTPGSEEELRQRRMATDRAAANLRRLAAGSTASLGDVTRRLGDLAGYRERADVRTGTPDRLLASYTAAINEIIGVYQHEFSHTEDGDLTQVSRPVVSMLSASEMVAREDAVLALAGPSKELSSTSFDQFTSSVGAQRYLYETWVEPYLPQRDRQFYERIVSSPDWQTKVRIENAIIHENKDTDTGIKLPSEVNGWSAAHSNVSVQMATLNTDRAKDVLALGAAKADALQTEVAWLVGGSGAGLLLVVTVVVFTTRSVLRRLDGLHRRTVAVAERILPDVVARLDSGRPVDESALPRVTGHRDEVGRINDAFARVVAVSVDGHRQLAAERHGFGAFASGIASRTGNLVSRQLALTEDIQDSFGHDEALLAQLMRSDQLTVGMRRQVENLLILSDGEIPDPHTEPMRIADLLREAAAEVEDFRRIERQALDEASVEPQFISQISHLLAELLDNATRFSPPRSKVVIRAELVADGVSVEVEDRGPRVPGSRYEEMNQRLHTAPPYAVLAENAHRLGLFVVGHLADQLGATVTLRRSVYGGTSAVVVLPAKLLVPAAAPAAAPARADASAPGVPAPARPEPAPGRAPDLVPATAAEPAPAPAPVPVPAAVPASATGPRAADPAPLPTSAGLPSRRRPEPPATRDGGGAPRPALPGRNARPALPERVPQTHMTERLRGPRAPETAVVAPDPATPEEVADAWADYEHGTQKVEEELRQDQP
ncbi:nitrate- and nitrite sensing domain-containing protein [Streptomyces sp. NPDC101206]|uniref:sensor histidine kinase n=1 Tax=Streptomyces sp. NPDC101206 TaxID=3366128 RepID=UPI0038287261